MGERIQRQVWFDPEAFKTVRDLQQSRGMGGKAFSAATNAIILEWRELKARLAVQTAPTQPETKEA